MSSKTLREVIASFACDATDKKYDMWHGNAGKGIEFYGKDSGAGYEINLL